MADLMDLLKGQLSNQLINQLSGQMGVRREQTAVASKSLISSLLGGLAQNAMQGNDRAQSLNNALERDHDGSILDDLTGFLSGGREAQNKKMLDGRGIVNHTLDQKSQESVLDMASRMSGIDKGKAAQLLMTLAPMVMGALGREKRQQNLDSGGIASLLQNVIGGGSRSGGQGDITSQLLNTFLDRDRDGSSMDDVAGMGLKMLGNFFGGK